MGELGPLDILPFLCTYNGSVVALKASEGRRAEMASGGLVPSVILGVNFW